MESVELTGSSPNFESISKVEKATSTKIDKREESQEEVTNAIAQKIIPEEIAASKKMRKTIKKFEKLAKKDKEKNFEKAGEKAIKQFIKSLEEQNISKSTANKLLDEFIRNLLIEKTIKSVKEGESSSEESSSTEETENSEEMISGSLEENSATLEENSATLEQNDVTEESGPFIFKEHRIKATKQFGEKVILTEIEENDHLIIIYRGLDGLEHVISENFETTEEKEAIRELLILRIGLAQMQEKLEQDTGIQATEPNKRMIDKYMKPKVKSGVSKTAKIHKKGAETIEPISKALEGTHAGGEVELINEIIILGAVIDLTKGAIELKRTARKLHELQSEHLSSSEKKRLRKELKKHRNIGIGKLIRNANIITASGLGLTAGIMEIGHLAGFASNLAIGASGLGIISGTISGALALRNICKEGNTRHRLAKLKKDLKELKDYRQFELPATVSHEETTKLYKMVLDDNLSEEDKKLLALGHEMDSFNSEKELDYVIHAVEEFIKNEKYRANTKISSGLLTTTIAGTSIAVAGLSIGLAASGVSYGISLPIAAGLGIGVGGGLIGLRTGINMYRKHHYNKRENRLAEKDDGARILDTRTGILAFLSARALKEIQQNPSLIKTKNQGTDPSVGFVCNQVIRKYFKLNPLIFIEIAAKELQELKRTDYAKYEILVEKLAKDHPSYKKEEIQIEVTSIKILEEARESIYIDKKSQIIDIELLDEDV
jgi:hypothetical protein